MDTDNPANRAAQGSSGDCMIESSWRRGTTYNVESSLSYVKDIVLSLGLQGYTAYFAKKTWTETLPNWQSPPCSRHISWIRGPKVISSQRTTQPRENHRLIREGTRRCMRPIEYRTTSLVNLLSLRYLVIQPLVFVINRSRFLRKPV